MSAAERDLRIPIIKQGLVDRSFPKGEAVTRQVILTADPTPDVEWLCDGHAVQQGMDRVIDSVLTEVEHGLKEITYSLSIPAVQHADTGRYSFRAKNKWGECESQGQLTVTLKPEVEGLRDAACVPGERTEFTAKVTACPPPTVTWMRNGQPLESSEYLEVRYDHGTGVHRVLFNKVAMADVGEYVLHCSNAEGVTDAAVRLNATSK